MQLPLAAPWSQKSHHNIGGIPMIELAQPATVAPFNLGTFNG
ncbi:unnamed protein product [Acidithrix sp. C25]|nr:unnamed protein product [Acidithrix sp. C25]